MLSLVRLCLVVEVLLNLAQVLSAGKYRFILQNQDVFTACPDMPGNVLSIQDAFDLSRIEFKYMDMDSTLAVSGNATTRWNIEKHDRVQVLATLSMVGKHIYAHHLIQISG